VYIGGKSIIHEGDSMVAFLIKIYRFVFLTKLQRTFVESCDLPLHNLKSKSLLTYFAFKVWIWSLIIRVPDTLSNRIYEYGYRYVSSNVWANFSILSLLSSVATYNTENNKLEVLLSRWKLWKVWFSKVYLLLVCIFCVLTYLYTIQGILLPLVLWGRVAVIGILYYMDTRVRPVINWWYVGFWGSWLVLSIVVALP